MATQLTIALLVLPNWRRARERFPNLENECSAVTLTVGFRFVGSVIKIAIYHEFTFLI
jgi:hypothetical protein